MHSTREMMRRSRAMCGKTGAEKSFQMREADGFRPACPLPAVTESKQEKPAPEAAAQRVIVPQPVRENSVYRQLMRSHDRMGTQHLKG